MSTTQPPLLVICDYDRTLFDSGSFGSALIAAAKTAFDVDLAGFRQNIQAASAGFGYEPFQDLARAGIAESAAFEILDQHLIQESFLFPDAGPFLGRLNSWQDVRVQIVTVGSPLYQKLKLQPLIREFPDIPVHIIPLNKGVWLEQQWTRTEIHKSRPHQLTFHGQSYRGAVLVDDRAGSFENLPYSSDIKGIHIIRPGAKYQDRHVRSTVVDGLEAASQLIQEFRLRSY